MHVFAIVNNAFPGPEIAAFQARLNKLTVIESERQSEAERVEREQVNRNRRICLSSKLQECRRVLEGNKVYLKREGIKSSQSIKSSRLRRYHLN